MRIEHMRYLLEVANVGSINKASHRCHMNQQHLIKIVTALEIELGIKIFERTNKGVIVTAQGQRVLDWGKAAVDSYDALQADLARYEQNQHNEIAGQLIVASMSTIFGQKYNMLIRHFADEYPEVNIIFEENSTRQIIQQIKDERIHVGIILLIHGIDKKSELLDNSLQFMSGYKSRVVVYASPKSKLAQTHTKVTMDDLRDEQFVIYKPYTDVETVAAKTLAHFGDYNIKYVISNLSTFHEILEEGQCVHIGSQKAGYMPSDGLKMLPVKDKISYEVGLLIHKKNINQPIVKAFVDFYEKNFME